MVPLEVVVRLGSPLAYPCRQRPFPITLDALVVALLARREGRHLLEPPDPAEDPYAPERAPDNGVPLVVAGRKYRFYQASAMELGPGARFFLFGWVRRFPAEDMLLRSDYGKYEGDVLAPGSGKYRCWMERLPAVAVPEIRFQCVGDEARLRDLLGDLLRTGIGVRRAVGMGEVASVEVRPLDRDPRDAGLFDGYGRPARPLPAEEFPAGGERGWVCEWWAYRPPYWSPACRTWCWVPPVERWYPYPYPLPEVG